MLRHLTCCVTADTQLQTALLLLLLLLVLGPDKCISPPLCDMNYVTFVHASHCLRYFVHLAMALPSLEPFVCNDLLKTACVSLAQVRSTDPPARLCRWWQ